MVSNNITSRSDLDFCYYILFGGQSQKAWNLQDHAVSQGVESLHEQAPAFSTNVMPTRACVLGTLAELQDGRPRDRTMHLLCCCDGLVDEDFYARGF